MHDKFICRQCNRLRRRSSSLGRSRFFQVIRDLHVKAIGVGFPRTGTMSLKQALETLGLGPCYHMIDVFDRPHDIQVWLQAYANNGANVDWDSIFNGFQSTADCPACCFWPDLLQKYPSAGFILTVRDADHWYDSFFDTVYQAIQHPERSPNKVHRDVQGMAELLILQGMFQGRFEDRGFAIHKYQQHIDVIRSSIPEGQLLEFDVSLGWEPLCRFFDRVPPIVDFPRANTRTEFRSRFDVDADSAS